MVRCLTSSVFWNWRVLVKNSHRYQVKQTKALPSWNLRYAIEMGLWNFRLRKPKRVCHLAENGEPRAVSEDYAHRTIYNMEESVLFFRMYSRRSYLGSYRSARPARGTDFHRQKSWITIDLCVNDDCSYSLAGHYIGNYREPRCFRDSHFSGLVDCYRFQENV